MATRAQANDRGVFNGGGRPYVFATVGVLDGGARRVAPAPPILCGVGGRVPGDL